MERTPDRSFSDLFRSSRAALATTAWGRPSTCASGHHDFQSALDGTRWIRQKVGHPRQRFVGLGIENVQDRANEQGVAGLLPMIAAFEGAFRIHQYIRDVLHVTNFFFAAPDLQQRVVGGGVVASWIKAEAVRESRAKPCGQLPVFSFDVMDDGRLRPGE